MSAAPPNPNNPSNWTRSHTAGCLATVLAIVLVALLGAPSVISWLLYAILMGTFTAIVADGITNRKVGILIDERNRMSLSRLQMALWSVLTISAFLAAAIGNTRANVPEPLNIAIPEAVWLLMGISTTSLVGTPLIFSAKRATPLTPHPPSTPGATPSAPLPGPSPAGPTAPVGAPPPIAATPQPRPLPITIASVLRAQGEEPTRMSVDGSLVVKHSADDASWADLFKGDELGDIVTLDLAKIQMFFFTVVLVLSYAIALGARFVAIDAARREPAPQVAAAPTGSIVPPDPRRFDRFPPLDLGFVTILGISNAGFLVNRAVPRDQPPPAPS
jgi:hypothetical protein